MRIGPWHNMSTNTDDDPEDVNGINRKDHCYVGIVGDVIAVTVVTL